MQIPAKLEAAACSHTGSVRVTNEDSFGVCLDAGVFVVCDGMGGAAAGEIASRLAVDALIERMCSSRNHEQDLEKALGEAIAAAKNARINWPRRATALAKRSL